MTWETRQPTKFLQACNSVKCRLSDIWDADSVPNQKPVTSPYLPQNKQALCQAWISPQHSATAGTCFNTWITSTAQVNSWHSTSQTRSIDCRVHKSYLEAHTVYHQTLVSERGCLLYPRALIPQPLGTGKKCQLFLLIPQHLFHVKSAFFCTHIRQHYF